MIKKKDLLDRIKQLEEQNKVLEFISQHNKDECIFESKGFFGNSFITYLYGGKLYSVELNSLPLWVYSIEENDKFGAIIKETHLNSNFYYKLDKVRQTITDITYLQTRIQEKNNLSKNKITKKENK